VKAFSSTPKQISGTVRVMVFLLAVELMHSSLHIVLQISVFPAWQKSLIFRIARLCSKCMQQTTLRIIYAHPEQALYIACFTLHRIRPTRKAATPPPAQPQPRRIA
jgi:hypothetical protein